MGKDTSHFLKIFWQYRYLLIFGFLFLAGTSTSFVLGSRYEASKAKKIAIAPTTTAIPSPTTTLTPTFTPTPTNIPIPKVLYPSEKALQIAAFLWIRNSSDAQAQIRSKLGGATDTETINNWALDMDKNPAIFAENEASMQSLQQQNNYQSSWPDNVTYTQVGSELRGSNGSTCTTVGSQLHCTGGY